MKEKIQSLTLFIICILLTSCIKNENDKYRKHTLKIPYNSIVLNIELPISYDTIYSWIYKSDCPDAKEFRTRFANKKYTLLTEDGSFTRYKIDSLNQITFSWLERKESDKTYSINGFEQFGYPNKKVFFINGYKSKQEEYISKRDSLQLKRIITKILINESVVTIKLEYLGKDYKTSERYYNQMIKQIKIKE